MYLLLGGSNKYQVKYIQKKATAWAISIVSGCVKQNKLWKALNPKIPKTIKHPLSAMALNKKECKHIMRPIVKFGRTKAGRISTLHTAVRDGPQYLGGIGLFDPFVIQGAGQIAFLI